MRDVATGAEQTIISNRIHPYFVQTKRKVANSSEGHVYAGVLDNGHWVDAQYLEVGDRLLNSDESWSEVVSVEVVEKPLKAYNLTVANDHTYFIAGAANDNFTQNNLAKAVWVHNDCNLDDLADGWKKLDDNTVIGVYGTKYEIQDDGTLLNVGSASTEEIATAGVQLRIEIPTKASDILAHIKQTGNAPAGYKGGRKFKNDGRGSGEVLPQIDEQGNPITYKEYDINPYIRGRNRGAERIVIGSDGNAYYTLNHYKTFVLME